MVPIRIEFFTRVVGWYIFKPKIPIWINFGGPCNGRCLYILWTFGIFSAIWYTYFTAIWNIWLQFGNFSPFGMLHQEKSGNPDFRPANQCANENSICRSERKKNSSEILFWLQRTGLPDFSWYKTPKTGKIYQITTSYTKCT
jgi:hypothetical protein